MNYFRRIFKKHPKKLIFFSLLLIAYYFCLPKVLFKTPTATVIESRQGNLLGAKIADDGQWRFPVIDSVPKKFEICLLQFEDAYFYKHFGFNPVSMAKAVRENIVASKTVRGGSALTKQVIRLSINKRTLIFRNNTYATIGYFLHILAYQNLQLCRT